MSKRLATAVLALGLVATACTEPPAGEVAFGSGKRFVPEVADFLDNAGVDPSIAVTPDGVPHIVYFGFVEQLPAGGVAPQRPIGAPSLPGVMLASVDGGSWTLGAVAMQAAIPNVNVAFSPAAVGSVKDLTASSVAGTAMVVDGQGKLHVAWASTGEVWYASNASGSFEASRVVSGATGVKGPSIAVDDSGMPWIAYYEGDTVDVATQMGKRWDVTAVATVGELDALPVRTGVTVTEDGPIVAYADPSASATLVARQDRKSWTSVTVDSESAGLGLSMATDAEGNAYLSYYGATDVIEAHSVAGARWQVSRVGSYSSGGSLPSSGWTTSIAPAGQGASFLAWYDPQADAVRLASGVSGTFVRVPTGGTAGGEAPSVAVASEGSSVYLTWYDHVNQNLGFGTYGEVSGLALAAQPSPTGPAGPATAPSSAPPAAGCRPKGTELAISAEGLAFDTNCLAAPADTPFTIAFDNKDAGIPHNVAIYTDSSAASKLFVGAIVTGPTTTTYEVPALKAGTYFFRCDVHPTTMTGTFVVE